MSIEDETIGVATRGRVWGVQVHAMRLRSRRYSPAERGCLIVTP